MSPTLNAIIGISIIFVCTSLGSSFVFFFRKKVASPKVREIFLGFASGIMLAASIFSLILPAIEQKQEVIPSYVVVGLSVALGAAFIWGIDHLVPHFHHVGGDEGIKTTRVSKNAKMFLAVTIHNVPEGFSVGIAYGVALAMWASNPEFSLLGALVLAIGIGIQNIPEGAVVALSYKGEGKLNFSSFLYGVGSGAVEPIAAVLGLFLAMQIASTRSLQSSGLKSEAILLYGT